MKRILTFLMLAFFTGCGFQAEGTPSNVPIIPAPEIPTASAPGTSTVASPLDPEQETDEPVLNVVDAVWETAVTACASTERNEVCQAGQTTALSTVPQVSWGYAPGDEPLLRLEADLDVSEGALTLIGLGSGQIVELTTLVVDETAVAIPFATTDEETAVDLTEVLEPAPQQITFFSESGTIESPSGLLLITPPSAMIASLGLNGTQITLLGSAWAEATPGGNLTLTPIQGDVMLSVAGADAVADVGRQITVPLSPEGLATGQPQMSSAVATFNTAPLASLANKVTENPDDLLTPLVESEDNTPSQVGDEEGDDLLTPLVSPDDDDPNWFQRKQLEFHYRKFLRSYNRCLSDRPDAARYVYNTLYWLRKFETIPFLNQMLGSAGLAQLHDMARQCATFDVDFGSTMTLSGSGVMFAAELKAENIHVQFSPSGGPFQGGIEALQYRSLTLSGAEVPGCTLEISHPDGTLRLDDGSLAIQENGLRVRLSFLPDVPQESFQYTCGGISAPPSSVFNWFPLFMGLYADIFSEKGFTVTDWHYVGGELMAEAILDRTMTLDGGTLTATTYLVLVHNP